MAKARSLINKMKRRKKFLNRNRGLRQLDKMNLMDEILARSPRAFSLLSHAKERLARSLGVGQLPQPDKELNAKLAMGDLERVALAPEEPEVPAEFASYGPAQEAGMTTDVTIDADVAGDAGNDILLSFDGVLDIDAVLEAWNLANPSNTATLTGDGSQIPDNGESIQLSGGSDLVPLVPEVPAHILMTLSSAVGDMMHLKAGDIVDILTGDLEGKSLEVISSDSNSLIHLEDDSDLSAPETDAQLKLQKPGSKKSYV